MTKEKKKRGCLKPFFIILILVVVILGAMIYLGGKVRNAMEQPVNVFMEQVGKADMDAAYAGTSKDFQQRITQTAMVAMIESNQLASASITSWNFGPDDGRNDDTLETDLVLTNGKLVPFRFSLRKTEEIWQITDIGKPIPKPVKVVSTTTKTPGKKKTLSFGFTTANLKNVGLSNLPDSPRTITREFPNNSDAIYFVADLCSAMDDTSIIGNWYFLGEDGSLSPSEPALTKELMTGSAVVTFSIIRTKDVIRSGKYRLDILIEGKVKHQELFSIRDATLEELKSAADAGSSKDAFMIFAQHLQDGELAVPANVAFEYLKMAAERGHARAMYNIGVMHARGIYLKQDDTQAKRWYRKAASAGNGSAILNLSMMYKNGGSEIEIEEALNWTKNAADAGDPYAIFALGVYMLKGTGTPKDLARAVEQMETAARSSAELALMLANQREISKDPAFHSIEESKKWYKNAADRGNQDASN